MSKRFLLVATAFGVCASVAVPVKAEVERTDPGVSPIIWSDDFVRVGGAEFLDQQAADDYCLYGTATRPQYTAVDPILSGGYNSTSLTISEGILGVNHDEYRNVPPIPPFQICFALLGWHNTTGPCVGGSQAGEQDYQFDDNDICIYAGGQFNPYHLNYNPIDDGPWGPDFRTGYAGVDDDGDGTTDWNSKTGPDYKQVGGNNQDVGATNPKDPTTIGTYFGGSTPDHMSVLGTYTTPGCTNRFPNVEEYDIRVNVAGFYFGADSNGLDDDGDGTIDNETIWRATVRRLCDNVLLALNNGLDDDADGATDEGDETSMFFPNGQTVFMDRGLSLRFENIPPLTQPIPANSGNGAWDIGVWPTQFVNSYIAVTDPSTVSELYGRNQKFNSGNAGYVDPKGPDGKAGIANVDDDGNGVTDEFPTEGRPNTDDDADGTTDEFDEVVLDDIGERSAAGSDDADDVLGSGAESGGGLRANIGVGSGIYVSINPNSGGGRLFSLSEYVNFQANTLEASNEVSAGFYQPGVQYSWVFCVSGTCYGAQLWVGDDVSNPVETVGPLATTDHTGVQVAIGAQQGGKALLHLMERMPVTGNALYDNKFWAIEGTEDSPTVTVAMDRDKDADVDGVDFSVFASCFNKAGNPPRTAGCTAADAAAMDSDNDGDVDGVDFSVFASCFNKAGNLPRAAGCYVEVASLTACP